MKYIMSITEFAYNFYIIGRILLKVYSMF